MTGVGGLVNIDGDWVRPIGPSLVENSLVERLHIAEIKVLPTSTEKKKGTVSIMCGNCY